MINKNKNKIILLNLIILFSFIKSEIEFETIKLNNEILTIDNLTESKYYYHALFESQTNIPNYLKIISNEKYENTDKYEYALSFYEQDSTFTNRIQLSKLSNSPIIWLNKEEIQNGFYFSIECYINKCNEYYINIYPCDFVELKLGQQYSYFVTNENKNMKFSFIGESLINQTVLNNNNNIIIWTRGNEKISSQLEGNKYEEHSKYNAYIIKSEIIEVINYSLIVEATVGDFINVGGLIFDNNDDNNHNICQNCDTIFSDFEMVGFLKKNLMEENCFEISNYKDDIHIIPIDNNDIEIPISNYWNKTNKYACARLPDNIDELFFIFQNIKYNEHNNEKNNFIYYNLFPGYNYHQYLTEGINLGYIPINIEDDFKFLTYNIFTENINNKIYMITCSNYPFCYINEEEISKSIPIKNHLGYYSISFNKTELSIDFSPISKIKKIVIITNNNDIINKDNDVYVNIYTDKTQIIIPSEIPIQYKYIRKENEDNLIIKENNKIFGDKDETFINIELLSGDISLNTNSTTNSHYEYKKIHLFSLDKKEIFSLKIKAKKNSVYSIKYYHTNLKNEYINFVPFGGNYLIYIEKISYIILVNSLKIKNNNIQKYISFYPKNKKTEINYNSVNNNLKAYTLPETNKTIYQDIFIEEQDSLHIKTFHLNTNINNNKSNPYLLYMSSSYFENDNNEILDNSIILEENIPKIFIFNEKYKSNKYTYLFCNDDNNKDLNISFNLLNNGIYEINLLINNIEFEQKFNITSNKTKKIEYNDWKDICSNEQQICKISFNIISNNLEQDSFLEIFINQKEEENKDDGENENNEEEKENKGNKKKKKNKTLLVAFLVILCIILFITIIFLIVVCIKANDKLEEEVKKISFINEDEKELRQI